MYDTPTLERYGTFRELTEGGWKNGGCPIITTLTTGTYQNNEDEEHDDENHVSNCVSY